MYRSNRAKKALVGEMNMLENESIRWTIITTAGIPVYH